MCVCASIHIRPHSEHQQAVRAFSRNAAIWWPTEGITTLSHFPEFDLCFLWCLHYKKTDDGPNTCEAVSCPTPSSSFLNTVLPLQRICVIARHHGGFFLFFFSCSCISAASLHIVWLWSRTTEMCPRPLPALSEPSLGAFQQILRRASSRTSCLSCFD